MPYRKAHADYVKHPYIPARDPLATIPPSRHPFQAWIMVACIIAGAGNLVDSQSAINDVLPAYIVKIWAISLLAAGALTLTGAYFKDRIMGLLIERAGLTTLCGAAVCYGVAIILVAGPAAAVPGPLTISIGIAAGWRVIHVNRELKVLSRFISKNYLDGPSEEA